MKFGIIVFPGSNGALNRHCVPSKILRQEVELVWYPADERGGRLR